MCLAFFVHAGSGEGLWHQSRGVLVSEEIALATRLYAIAQSDSRVGYEPAMQYFYLPQDIRERIVGCRYMLATQIPEAKRQVAN